MIALTLSCRKKGDYLGSRGASPQRIDSANATISDVLGVIGKLKDNSNSHPLIVDLYVALDERDPAMPSVAEDLGGGGGCMAWRFQQQDKRQKAMSNGGW
jgi:hypothetical protein